MVINMKTVFKKLLVMTSLIAMTFSGCGKTGEENSKNEKVLVSDTVAVQVAKI